MFSYLFIGSNDLHAAETFYQSVLTPLGYEMAYFGEKLNFFIPGLPDPQLGPGAIFIARPKDGQPATPGNGIMPAFRALTREDVDRVFQAGLQAGGADEGKPGTREEYGSHFYVAYLRDPDGNKLAVFCLDEES